MKQLSLIFFLICNVTLADSTGDSDPFALHVLNAYYANSFPNTEMKDGRVISNLSPSRFSFTSSRSGRKADIDGYGLSVRGIQNLFDTEIGHFGWGGSFFYFKGDGTGSNVFLGSDNSTGVPANVDVEGMSLSVFAMMDLFKKYETFSYPMYIGVAYISTEDSMKTDTTVTGSTNGWTYVNRTTSSKYDGPAIIAGMAPQKDFGQYLRFRGIAVITFRPKDPDIKQADNLGSTGGFKDPNAILGGLGLEAIYRPWDVGVLWVPDLVTSGASLLSLTFTKNWD